MSKAHITIEFLRECFEIDFVNGGLRWRVRPLHHFKSAHAMNAFNARYAGAVVGKINKHGKGERIMTKVGGVDVLLHRVVYALHHSLDLVDVPAIIDHGDCDQLNNRPNNLRAATPAESAWNTRVNANSKTGVKGVFKTAGKARPFFAHIKVKGYRVPLGTYATLEEAAAAYRNAAIELHGEFARY